MKNLCILMLYAEVTFGVHAQTTPTGGHPDLPGTFTVEWGIINSSKKAKNFATNFFGSRSINIYYQYPFQLPVLNNKFSFVPGIGLGLDQFKLSTDRTLAFESGSLTMSRLGLEIDKSKIVTNYLDVPLEIKFTNKPDDPNRSFKFSIGFRPGVLISSYTKIVYNDDDGNKVRDKRKRDWNVNRLRYGVYGKIGLGSFSLFAYSNISTLFQSGQGPDDGDVNTISIGISLASF